MKYQDKNEKAITRWIEEGWEWGEPISHQEFVDALNGKWDIKLTPTKFAPHKWFGDLNGKKILGLASGGGQQAPIFKALGADVTVLDYTQKQLDSEEMVAKRENYKINLIKGDMSKPLPFENQFFDIIFWPVSNCYVEDIKPIFKECFRVLKHGGVLIIGQDNGGLNYAVNEDETKLVNKLPFNPLKNPKYMKELEEQDGGVQFSHTLEETLGGQLEAGFILTDIYEDTNGEGRLHELNIPSYMATRAIKN
jgi:SAM-dependent methyltransferase